MRRKEAYEIEKVTVNLRKGDKGRLADFHGRLGYGKVVRELVIAHIGRVEAKAASLTGQLDLKLEDKVLPQ